MRVPACLFVLTLILQGCTYAVSPAVADRAEKTIPFTSLAADPDAYQGKLFILGGAIVETTAVKAGTLIEVLQVDLDYWGKPERTSRTGGRFFAVHQGHLDALVYAPGRSVTIAGEVQGTGSPMLGERRFDGPVLLTKEIKLWERDSHYGSQPQWMDPLYDPDYSGRRGW